MPCSSLDGMNRRGPGGPPRNSGNGPFWPVYGPFGAQGPRQWVGKASGIHLGGLWAQMGGSGSIWVHFGPWGPFLDGFWTPWHGPEAQDWAHGDHGTMGTEGDFAKFKTGGVPSVWAQTTMGTNGTLIEKEKNNLIERHSHTREHVTRHVYLIRARRHTTKYNLVVRHIPALMHAILLVEDERR